jgi:hypothetical protein
MDFFQGIDYQNAIKSSTNMDSSQEYGKNFHIIHESNGDIFEGEVITKGDTITKHGVGKLISKTGNIFEGVWRHNQIDGICKIRYNNGDIYEG